MRTMIVVAVVIALSGCEKYIPYEGENAPRKLVLNGQIEADSVFNVELSHSLGYVDPGPIEEVENGTVNVLLESGEFIETLDHIGDGRYRGDQIAVAGQGYRVEASAGPYPSILAVDQVPPVIEIAAWDTLSGSNNDPMNPSFEFTISFQVNDPGGAQNYYMIEVFESRNYDLVSIGFDPVTGQDLFDTLFYDVPQLFRLGLSTTDLVLSAEYDAGLGEVEVYGNNFLFTDELFNGALREFTLNIDHYAGGSSDLELRLTSLSADLYRYYRSLERYQQTNGDPFSEPVQVFTNIQGGLGIWGGRASHVVLIGL